MARPPLPPGEAITGGVITFRITVEQRKWLGDYIAQHPDMTQTDVIRKALDGLAQQSEATKGAA